MMTEPTFTVSEFVAVVNQTLEYAYPGVTITGELANFRVSKNRWVYFDLKDGEAAVRFFGTVYQLPGPLEDGMMVAVRGMPRLHPQYGFSVTVGSIMPTGEGSIKKAAKLLEAKLAAEGLFDTERKRPLPYPPAHIGLITSGESAAYHDFIKVLGARWGGLQITFIDVQVQGEVSSGQVVQAIRQLNEMTTPPDAIVLTRGGGSTEDLQAFSTEQVTRAVAASRIPTIVAIGHEVDVSLAELAADQRASTPSNAAELLVPDRSSLLAGLDKHRQALLSTVERSLAEAAKDLQVHMAALHNGAEQIIISETERLSLRAQLLEVYSPYAAFRRGYALARKATSVICSGREVQVGDTVELELLDALLTTQIKSITMKMEK